MSTEQIDQILLTHAGLYDPDSEELIRQRLVGADEATAQTAFADLKGTTKMLIVSVLLGILGIDRFMLGQTLLGVIKLATAGGCGLWLVIDWFTTADRTRQFNTRKILDTLRISQGN